MKLLKRWFVILAVFLICLLPSVKSAFAAHSATNVVVNNLAVFAISSVEARWTATGSTAGVIIVGTTNDPASSPLRSVSTNTNAGVVNFGSMAPGSYYVAMYTGFGASLTLMSNVANFNMGGGDSGGAECSGLTNCISTGITNRSNRSSSTFVGDIITDILPLVIAFGGFLAIIMIVISGIQFITSSGDPNGAAAARGRLVFALIGFALLALAFMVTKLIDAVFLRNSGIFG